MLGRGASDTTLMCHRTMQPFTLQTFVRPTIGRRVRIKGSWLLSTNPPPRTPSFILSVPRRPFHPVFSFQCQKILEVLAFGTEWRRHRAPALAVLTGISYSKMGFSQQHGATSWSRLLVYYARPHCPTIKKFRRHWRRNMPCGPQFMCVVIFSRPLLGFQVRNFGGAYGAFRAHGFPFLRTS